MMKGKLEVRTIERMHFMSRRQWHFWTFHIVTFSRHWRMAKTTRYIFRLRPYSVVQEHRLYHYTGIRTILQNKKYPQHT